ncbi:MAG: hypothetical protein H6934_07750 [Burkholderiaceae bacterium]|nr:hypothetical protein [Burkholderiaceae bacterium]
MSTESTDKYSIRSLCRLVVPMGGQEIELQQVDFAVGGMSLLRTRIREGRRFTVFDIDPATARQWGDALSRWAAAQPVNDGEPARPANDAPGSSDTP